MNYYNNNQELHNVIDFIAKNDIAGKRFPEIANIVNNDPYMVLADYRRMQQYAVSVWADKKKWQQMSLMNISGAGIFSADRAIHEYAENIWHTKSAFKGEKYPTAEPVKAKETAEQPSEKVSEKKPAEKKAAAKTAAKTAASAGKKAKKKKK